MEIVVLIQVGSAIGALPTIGLVLLTAFLGLALLRQQGLSTLFRAQEKVRAGGIPVTELVEGVFLAVGGALLLTPGFVTDAIGLACLLPGSRQLVIGWGVKSVMPYVKTQRESAPNSRREPIEGDFKREE